MEKRTNKPIHIDEHLWKLYTEAEMPDRKPSIPVYIEWLESYACSIAPEIAPKTTYFFSSIIRKGTKPTEAILSGIIVLNSTIKKESIISEIESQILKTKKIQPSDKCEIIVTCLTKL